MHTNFSTSPEVGANWSNEMSYHHYRTQFIMLIEN